MSCNVLETYDVLKGHKSNTHTLVQWHFDKFLLSTKKRFTLKRKFRDPFTCQTSREINVAIFYEVYCAVRIYKSNFGYITSTVKNKKGNIRSYEIKFTHQGAFEYHMSELSGFKKSDVKKYLQKTFPNNCKARVVVSTEKPVLLIYKRSTSVCNLKCFYETINSFGNVTSY